MATIKATIQIDNSPAVQALRALAGEGDKSSAQIIAAFKKALAPSDTGAGAKAFDGIRKAAQETVNEQKAALAALIASGQTGGSAYDKLRAQLAESAKEAKRLDDAMEQVNKEVADANSAPLSLGDKIKGGLGDSFNASALGGLVGGGLSGVVTAGVSKLVEGFQAAIDIGKEFETGLQAVSAVTGVTGPALDDIGNRARDLALKFGGDASAQLEVFGVTLSKIGPQLAQSPEALGKFADNVNTLSKTDAALGAAGAVDALTSSLLQFGVDVNNSSEVAAESSRFINVLAASAAAGSASVSSVAEAVGVVGATAKNANLSFEETNAALQVLASKSLVGSQAGTALTSVLVKLQSQSKEGDDALKALGTSSSKLGDLLNTKGLGAAIDELRGAMSKLGSQTEKNALLNKLFGEGGQNAAAALLGGGEMLAQFTEAVTGTNAAAEQAAINMNTLSERMSRGSAAVKDVAIAAYQAIVPVLNQIIGIFSETLGPVFSSLADSIGGTFKRIWEVISPILALIGGAVISSIVVTLQYAATFIRTMSEAFNRGFDAIKRALAPLGAAIAKLFGSDGEIGKGVDIVQIFTDALSFVGEVMTALSDIVLEIGTLWFEFVLMPLQAIVSVISGIITKVREFFGVSKQNNEEQKKGTSILDTLRAAFSNIQGTIAGVTEAFREIKTVVNEFFTQLGNLDIKAALAALTGFGDRVTQAYDRGFTSVQKTKDAAAAAAAEEARRAKEAEAVAAAKQKEASTENEALKAAKERFTAARAILDEERKREQLAIRQKALTDGTSDEELKLLLKKNELETQRKIIEAYEKAFKVAKDSSGLVASVGFRVNKDELTGIKSEFDDLVLKAFDIESDLLVQFDAKKLEKDVTEQLKKIETLFKQRSADLAEGLLEPGAFTSASETLVENIAQVISGLQARLELPEIKANPKATAAILEQIDVAENARITLRANADKALDKADEDRLKKSIDTNRRRIELLKGDEAGNAAEIRRLLEDNLAFETSLKLRGVKASGDAAIAERQLILQEAEKSAAEIAKKYADAPDRLTQVGLDAIAGLSAAFNAFGEEQRKAREAAAEQLQGEEQDLRASLRNKEISISEFYSRQAELRTKAGGGPSLTDALLGATREQTFNGASKVIAEFTEKQKAQFAALAADGTVSFDALGQAVAGTLGGGLLSALKSGEEGMKGLLSALASAAAAALDMLIPLITGQFLGFLGPFALPAATLAVQGLKALMNTAISGADRGVVGIDHNYRARPSERDTIPVMMRRGESAVIPEATERNRDILKYFNDTAGRWQEYAINNLTREELSKALNLKGLGIGFEGRDVSKLDVSTHPQVVALELQNAELTRELKGVRKEIRSLKGEITTRQTVEVIPRIDPQSLVREVKVQNANRFKGR